MLRTLTRVVLRQKRTRRAALAVAAVTLLLIVPITGVMHFRGSARSHAVGILLERGAQVGIDNSLPGSIAKRLPPSLQAAFDQVWMIDVRESRKITDEDVLRLEGLADLHGLFAKRSLLTDRAAKLLATMPRLKYLDLDDTSIGDTTIATAAAHCDLVSLSAEGTSISDAALTAVAGTSGLRELYLDRTLVTDAGMLEALPRLNGLVDLSVANTNVSDTGLVDVGRLSDLRYANFTGTRIADATIGALGRCRGLRYLYADRTAVTDAGVAALAGCVMLEDLSLAKTGVTDHGVAHLTSLPHLKFLDLTDTSVGDASLHTMRALKGLRELYLGRTNVTAGGISDHAEGLQHLAVLFVPQQVIDTLGRSALEGWFPNTNVIGD